MSSCEAVILASLPIRPRRDPTCVATVAGFHNAAGLADTGGGGGIEETGGINE